MALPGPPAGAPPQQGGLPGQDPLDDPNIIQQVAQTIRSHPRVGLHLVIFAGSQQYRLSDILADPVRGPRLLQNLARVDPQISQFLAQQAQEKARRQMEMPRVLNAIRQGRLLFQYQGPDGRHRTLNVTDNFISDPDQREQLAEEILDRGW